MPRPTSTPLRSPAAGGPLVVVVALLGACAVEPAFDDGTLAITRDADGVEGVYSAASGRVRFASQRVVAERTWIAPGHTATEIRPAARSEEATGARVVFEDENRGLLIELFDGRLTVMGDEPVTAADDAAARTMAIEAADAVLASGEPLDEDQVEAFSTIAAIAAEPGSAGSRAAALGECTLVVPRVKISGPNVVAEATATCASGGAFRADFAIERKSSNGWIAFWEALSGSVRVDDKTVEGQIVAGTPKNIKAKALCGESGTHYQYRASVTLKDPLTEGTIVQWGGPWAFKTCGR